MQAIQEGQRERAKDLLTRLLKTDQKNPNYWLWLSSVVDTSSEKIFCLESVLKVDSGNQAARRGLILFGAIPADESILPVPPVRRKWVAELAEEDLPKSRFARLMRKPIVRIATILVSGLIVVGLVVLGTYLRPLIPEFTFIRVTGTAKSIAGLLPTATVLTPTPTIPTPTVNPQGTAPPLWTFLEATYTPTPRYVNTPHPVQEAYSIAMRRFDQGNYTQMVTFLEQAVRENPESADLYYYLGEGYQLMGNPEKALAAYQEAIKVNPNFAPAYLARAQILPTLTPNADVKNDLDQAITLDPNLPEAYLERATYYTAKENYVGALSDLDSIENLNSNDPRLYVLRAQVYLKQKLNVLALVEAQKGYELDLTSLPAYRTLAEALLANDRPAQAFEKIEIYLRYIKTDSKAWLIDGLAAVKTGKNEAAFNAMDKALALDSKLPEAYYYRGLLYLELGEGQNAVNDLIEAQRFLPNSFDVSLELGRALWKAGRFGDAFNQLSGAENLAKDDQQLAAVYYWRGQVLEDGQNPRAAQSDYEKLLALPVGAAPQTWLDFAQQRLLVINPPTATPTITPTRSLTPTITLTRTSSPTPTPTPSLTRRPSITPTASLTPRLSATVTPRWTATPSRTSTAVRTPTRTPTP